MTDAISPALTAEEWKAAIHGTTRSFGDERIFVIGDDLTINFGDSFYDETIDSHRRHALAALCLYQQPFGFSWADVAAIRQQVIQVQSDAQTFAALSRDGMVGHEWVKRIERLGSLAARIAALLPPEEPRP